MSEQPIAVTVVGGYLGAGKTTLVNHVLRTSDQRVAVIVNDFGEISLDEDLIVAADGDKLTLANGCICCSLADGFVAALRTVRSSAVTPDRLLIEASGVADPAQVAAYGHTPGVQLDAVVVMADAEQIRRLADDRWVADIVRLQLSAADLLIVNKIDLLTDSADTVGAVDAADADAVCDWLADLSNAARLVRASHGQVPMEVLFGPEPLAAPSTASPTTIDTAPTDTTTTGAAPTDTTPTDAASALHQPRTAAHDLFESQTVELADPLPDATVTALLDSLPESVVRLKGLVRTVSAPVSLDAPEEAFADCVIQAVGARTSIAPSEPHRRWVVSLIARKSALAPDWLRNRLRTRPVG